MISQEMLAMLKSEGYENIREFPDGTIAATFQFLFTSAIISDIHQYGYEERWCYHTKADAIAALDNWNGIGEPTGWHRHPATGRRIIDGKLVIAR